MLVLLTLTRLALAGDVYVNGVDVGDMRNQTFENATVFFDSRGNIHVSAPGYQIQVVDPVGGSSTSPPPSTGPEPRVGQAMTASNLGDGAAMTTPEASSGATPGASDVGVEAGRWWLVTEDSGSGGHAVDVVVNGVVAQTVRSGAPQLIFDLGPYLRRGENRVAMRSNSVDATGGTLYLYVGTGRNDSGTVIMDAPDIQFGLGTSRSGPYEREYTVTVP